MVTGYEYAAVLVQGKRMHGGVSDETCAEAQENGSGYFLTRETGRAMWMGIVTGRL